MDSIFDHEKLRAYQEALRFCGWVQPILDRLPTRLAARDQLDRASTSVVLNVAEGNGKRSPADRCRYLDIARGSALECSACLDVLIAKKLLDHAEVQSGKEILLQVVRIISGLIGRFSGEVREEQAAYCAFSLVEKEKD